jgi:hypothetical protein
MKYLSNCKLSIESDLPKAKLKGKFYRYLLRIVAIELKYQATSFLLPESFPFVYAVDVLGIIELSIETRTVNTSQYLIGISGLPFDWLN